MRNMKGALLFAILFPMGGLLQAQLAGNIGIKAGATMSIIRVRGITPTLYGTGDIATPSFARWENVVNPVVSLFVNVLTSPVFILQTELTYLQTGASYMNYYWINPDGPDYVKTATLTTEITLKYLVLSIAAQPRLALGNFAFYADVRPTFSYLLSSSNIMVVENQLSNVQAGYSLGIGFDFGKLLGRSLFLEVAYAGDFRYFYDYGYAKLWSSYWSCRIGTTL